MMSDFREAMAGPDFSRVSVLVTGAYGAIGCAVAEKCLKLGASVFAQGRDADKLMATIERWHEENRIGAGRAAIPLVYDITEKDSVKDVFREIQKKTKMADVGSLYGLINAAGVMHDAGLSMSSVEDFTSQLAVNLVAPYQHMQMAARLMMRDKQGSIVNICSQVGELGCAGLSAYAGSKAGLSGVTKSLAKELAVFNIRVNAVAPGFIETPMTAHYSDSQKEKFNARITLNRFGSAGEVANAVLYLLSHQSSYTTGAILPVDGMFSP